MNEDLAKRIGDGARAARKKLGLSQADAAERVGISVEFYGRIERGLTLPSTPTLVHIGRELGVTIDALVGGRAEPSSGRTTIALESREVRLLLRRLRSARPRTIQLLSLIAAAIEDGGKQKIAKLVSPARQRSTRARPKRRR